MNEIEKQIPCKAADVIKQLRYALRHAIDAEDGSTEIVQIIGKALDEIRELQKKS